MMRRPHLPILLTLFTFGTVSAASGQVQQAWVASYNAGSAIGTNQAIAMKLDTAGNIIVAGSSKTNSDFDYVTIKYGPNGTQSWARRYGSGGNCDDQIRGLAVDVSNNVYVTGTSVTIKYDADGVAQWTAPYAGRALAVDTNGNTYVTGFSETDFATVKLNAQGSNVWLRTYDLTNHADISSAIALDLAGNIYVAGTAQWWCDSRPSYICFDQFALVKYSPHGDRLFLSTLLQESVMTYNYNSEVKGALVSSDGSAYVTGNLRAGSPCIFQTFKVSNSGTSLWSYCYVAASYEGVAAMALDSQANAYLTGSDTTDRYFNTTYVTVKLDSSGHQTWVGLYNPMQAKHRATGIALDNQTNVYVTGYSPGAGTGNDFATLKYDTDGNQKWVMRYDGPFHGDDQANAIAVDAAGNVYVTGFSQTSSNLIELTTIKYSYLQNTQTLTTDHVLLQFFGSPGQSYRFQANTALDTNWVDIGSSLADTNGIYRFEDTNAPSFPHRFYRTLSP